MRILHIYSGNLYGGIETMLVTLARQRDLCPEMEPHFALCFEGRLSESLHATQSEVHQLGNVRVSRPISVLRARHALSELIRGSEFDVVICHAPWSQAIFGTVVRQAKLPLVFWMHGPTNGHHWSERWARCTRPDLVICNSHFTASTLSHLYSGVRAEVVYCPVAMAPANKSEDERRTTRVELKTAEDATVIIQVSRMERLKGQLLQVEALSRLRSIPNWVCWIVGGAQRADELSYYAELQSLANRLGIAERIRFIGERSDVARLLNAADIYCQPNTQPDAFGIAFIEALSAGLPVVTTALGGAPEIVDDSCGILVQPNDAGILASSLRSLIEDNSRRDTLGNAGPERARHLCDPEKQMAKIYELTSNLLEGSLNV